MKRAAILIIDDNRDLTDGLGEVLCDEGYRVTLAYNGKKGLAAIEAGDFDLVILDIKLPDMNGIEVFQIIHSVHPAVKVIVVTAYRIEQLLSEAVGDGEVRIFRKSMTSPQVSEALGQMVAGGIVLIVDDDLEFAENLTDHLLTRGVSALHGHDCRKAVAELVANPVEVMVLDVRMPIICGLGVHLQLRQQGRICKTVIVIGNLDEVPDSADVFRSALTTGCLFKPFAPEEMLVLIERVLAKQA